MSEPNEQEQEAYDLHPEMGDISAEFTYIGLLEDIMQHRRLVETGDRIIKDTLARIASGDKHPGIPVTYNN